MTNLTIDDIQKLAKTQTNLIQLTINSKGDIAIVIKNKDKILGGDTVLNKNIQTYPYDILKSKLEMLVNLYRFNTANNKNRGEKE